MCLHATWMTSDRCTRCTTLPKPTPKPKKVVKVPTEPTPQMLRVLTALEGATRLSEQQISDVTGDPLPSIRRSIQQLIQMGYLVTFAGVDGCYAALNGERLTQELGEC